MKASDFFVRCLEAEGIKYIFGVPGEENADVMMSLLDSEIEFITTRHEQGAAFMADVYGRLTGSVAVCLGTLGPGATNLVTGVGNGNMDRSPMMVVTGQGALNRLHKESHQAMDVMRMFEPITKWNAQIKTPDTISEIIRKASKLARYEKPGATHVELPEDVAKLEVPDDWQPLVKTKPRRPAPDRQAVQQAVELIKNAKLPFIISGNGAVRKRASAALRELQATTGIYGANTFMGKGAMGADSKYNLSTVGLQSRDHVSCAIERADLIIAIGYDLVEYHPRLWNHGNKKTIIHIDFEPAEVDRYYNPAVEINGDIADSLRRLNQNFEDKIEKRPDEKYFDELRERMLADIAEYKDDTEFPIKPQKILWDVRQALDKNDILISDVGAHKMWIARYFRAKDPNTVLIPNGFCSMGMVVPGVIAARLVYPDQKQVKVLGICGDGGFLMNVQELETAVRLKTQVVIMIWTDSKYGLIEWKQQAQFGKTSHIDFGNPDFVKLAESFGALGLRVKQTKDLPKILKKAFAHDGPVVIDCPVDYRENMKLTKRLGEIGCTI